MEKIIHTGKAFANADKLEILRLLREKSLMVNDIVEAIGVSQSRTSQLLGDLVKAGLVTYEVHGNQRKYVLNKVFFNKVIKLFEIKI